MRLIDFVSFWDDRGFVRDVVNVNRFGLEQECVKYSCDCGVSVSVDGVVFSGVVEVFLLVCDGVLCFSFDFVEFFVLGDVVLG